MRWAAPQHGDVHIHALPSRDKGDAWQAFVAADYSEVQVVNPDGAPVHKEPGLINNEHALERLEWKQAVGLFRLEVEVGENVRVAAVTLHSTGG